MAGSEIALPYHEPGIITILIQSGFLLVLNLVNSILDKLIFCGLIGQLFVGMAWGTPGASWLDIHLQEAIQQLGYLGLLLLVYEGGLSTSFSQLKANFFLCLVVATTGIAIPIGLSFTLMSIVSATPLQAFAAGAALCSTSIGTTFTILSITGLAKSRLGVVLSGAAMMDDVAGLVMVQIISNLGGSSSSSSFSAVTVIRPSFVAVAFAVGLLLICRFVIAAIVRKVHARKMQFSAVLKSVEFAFVAHMCLLLGLVTAAAYAGTSTLFAAYLAGACIAWFDEMLEEMRGKTEMEPSSPARGNVNDKQTESIALQQTGAGNDGGSSSQSSGIKNQGKSSCSSFPKGEDVFQRYCKAPLSRILSPLFFASIGFSIPITEMFHGDVVWRGIVYTILMAFGKVLTGLWLIRISLPPISFLQKLRGKSPPSLAFCGARTRTGKETAPSKKGHKKRKQAGPAETSQAEQPRYDRSTPEPGSRQASAAASDSHGSTDGPVSRINSQSRLPPKPRSLYPASIVGLAMVARGEIGFLIASVAESKGIFASSTVESSRGGSSEVYLVVIWAITLCTIIGPICVGMLVKRVKKLQSQRHQSGGEDPLGVWGLA